MNRVIGLVTALAQYPNAVNNSVYTSNQIAPVTRIAEPLQSDLTLLGIGCGPGGEASVCLVGLEIVSQ